MIQPIIQEKLLFPEILWSLPQNVHQRRGKVFVVAGNLGASIPTVETAQKIGVGVVRLGLPETVVLAGEKFLPGGLAISLPESREGTLSLKAADLITLESKNADVTVVGGGLTRNPETLQLVKRTLPAISSPLILFADALFGINLADLFKRKAPTVMVVDAGELGRLLGASGYQKHAPRTIVEHIYQQRFEVLSEAAATAQAVVVLHGPDTAVGSPDGRIVLEKTPIDKTEVFAGVAAGIISQNKSKPLEATATALHVYRIAKERSPDVVSEISAVIPKLEQVS